MAVDIWWSAMYKTLPFHVRLKSPRLANTYTDVRLLQSIQHIIGTYRCRNSSDKQCTNESISNERPLSSKVQHRMNEVCLHLHIYSCNPVSLLHAQLSLAISVTDPSFQIVTNAYFGVLCCHSVLGYNPGDLVGE